MSASHHVVFRVHVAVHVVNLSADKAAAHPHALSEVQFVEGSGGPATGSVVPPEDGVFAEVAAIRLIDRIAIAGEGTPPPNPSTDRRKSV